jgi:hypothetical protein
MNIEKLAKIRIKDKPIFIHGGATMQEGCVLVQTTSLLIFFAMALSASQKGVVNLQQFRRRGEAALKSGL